MADPRAANSLIGIGYVALTYPHDNTIVFDNELEGGSAQVGLAVTLEAANQVSLVGAGEQVEGVIVKVEDDGFCVVQTGGHVVMKAGTTPTLTAGAKIVGALLGAAEGYITAATAGTAANHVVSRGTILDGSDPTAVIVRLESSGPN